jgi:hypothetical protein
MLVYVLIYIHTDKPEFSEVLGIYKEKENAINKLIEKANYREIDGILTQYYEKTEDYESIDEIKKLIYNTNELIDEDIYRIQEKNII